MNIFDLNKQLDLHRPDNPDAVREERTRWLSTDGTIRHHRRELLVFINPLTLADHQTVNQYLSDSGVPADAEIRTKDTYISTTITASWKEET
ncbi:hypothetical protein [Glutamicibacter ardleyensis]|uniref:Uncharacterized protein n=1 Tax=Glutamicibacter ardleyensis TaxID=225894 RepID=A0ABQ2DGS8_9MICC|nr:hypothetical protein [Glutamicibacter ardleyensis]GGJ56012.1 hypothetical protein GCM10007173_13560 [Glutamicibacter ardleyensis]